MRYLCGASRAFPQREPASESGRVWRVWTTLRSLKPYDWSGGIHRSVFSVLAGMRLGNDSLNARLSKHRLVPSPLCECGDEETMDHFWLHCSNYMNQRDVLERTFVAVYRLEKPFSVMELLKFDSKDVAFSTILKAVVKFIVSSRRFS